MLKLGIIGTNWITKQFVDAAKASGEYTLTAVYSRHVETAQQFAGDENPDAALFTDLEKFFASSAFDTVYIASPNSLHAQQAMAALNAGKNVIVEKPMVASQSELEQLKDTLAAHPQQFLFEAARHLYEPNFELVKDFVQKNDVSGATLVYMKYSSKYDAYLAGKNPNVFTTRFAGGALMDLGVYLVYAALSWFGVPDKASYAPAILASGVDGSGVLHLDYPHFGVNLVCGKTTQSYLPSEIYTGKDTLVIDAPESISSIEHVVPGAKTTQLAGKQDKNPMIREAKYFAHAIATADYAARDQQFALATQVHTLISRVRKQAGIEFPNDHE